MTHKGRPYNLYGTYLPHLISYILDNKRKSYQLNSNKIIKEYSKEKKCYKGQYYT